MDDSVRVAFKRRVLHAVIRAEVSATGANVVVEHHLKVLFERRGHHPPHVLVATEPVREEDRLFADTSNLHIVANNS